MALNNRPRLVNGQEIGFVIAISSGYTSCVIVVFRRGRAQARHSDEGAIQHT